MDDAQYKTDDALQGSQNVATSQQAPVQPVGTIQKEQEMAAVSDYIKPSEEEPQLHPEVKEAGVEVVAKEPHVPADNGLGIKIMHEATPVITQPSGSVQLPMTEEEAVRVEKNSNISPFTALKWFATIAHREWKKRKRSV